MDASSDRIDIVRRFFTGTGKSYDRVVNIFTFGIDRLWKRKILNKIQNRPAAILDLACGTGILTFKLVSAFPNARVVGVDVTPEYLEIARARAEHRRTANVQFILARAEEVCLTDEFDCIVSSYLAKYANLRALALNAGKALRRGGMFIAHDFAYPQNRSFARLWELNFEILKTVGTRGYPEWREAFEGLPELLRSSMWVEELQTRLQENHFVDVKEERLTFGSAAMVTAAKS